MLATVMTLLLVVGIPSIGTSSSTWTSTSTRLLTGTERDLYRDELALKKLVELCRVDLKKYQGGQADCEATLVKRNDQLVTSTSAKEVEVTPWWLWLAMGFGIAVAAAGGAAICYELRCGRSP